MFRPSLIDLCLAIFSFATLSAVAQSTNATWSFAVSGDSRNCGDFVMPAIASSVKAEHDAFYWHLGDFRWMSNPDQDMVAMLPAGKELSIEEYHRDRVGRFSHPPDDVVRDVSCLPWPRQP